MTEDVSDLNARCNKYEADWIVVNACLSAIEKDSSVLSESSKQSLQKAKQCMGESVDVGVKTKIQKMHNIGTWLLTADFQASVRRRVIHCPILCLD